MKYWHRKIHLTLWLLILPALVLIFVTGDRIIRQQHYSSAVNTTDDFFQIWEEELNKNQQQLQAEQRAAQERLEREQAAQEAEESAP